MENKKDVYSKTIVMIDAELIDVVDQPMPEQSEEEKIAMAESIKESTLIYPLFVKKQEDGRYQVIDGRTRLEILKKLGHKYIPCIFSKDDFADRIPKILSFDLELCRRQLSDKDRRRLTKERATISSSMTLSFNDSIQRRLSPAMRNSFNEMVDKGTLTEEWRTLFYLIAQQPQGEQDTFFSTQANQPKDSGINETLNKKVAELEKALQTAKEKEAEIETLKEGYKRRFNDEVSAKVAEAEKRIKVDKTLSTKEISTAVAAERKKLTAQYEADMKEMNGKLRDLSRACKEKQDELDIMQQSAKVSKESKSLYESIIKTHKTDLEYSLKVISTLASADTITKQMEIALASVKSVWNSMKMVNTVPYSSEQKKTIGNCAGEIKDVLDLIEDIMKENQLKKTA
jgi:DNA-binding FrmR family transcriptional regulator